MPHGSIGETCYIKLSQNFSRLANNSLEIVALLRRRVFGMVRSLEGSGRSHHRRASITGSAVPVLSTPGSGGYLRRATVDRWCQNRFDEGN